MTNRRPIAIVLTALMVLSVMAAVPAAAVVTLSASGGSATASPGDTVSVTFSVTNSGDETGEAIVTVQNNSLPSAWSVDAISGDDPNPQDSFAVIQSGNEVAFSDVDAGETVTVTVDVSVPSGASAADYTLDASVEDGDNNAVGTPSSTITVEAAGDGDGDGDGEDDGDEFDAALDDGGTYWQGQTLRRAAGVDDGETMELREENADGTAGDLVRQAPDSDADGDVLIGTSNLDGQYVLEDSDNNIVAAFEVAIQDLTVDWASETVVNGGDDTTVDLQIDSNRGTYDVLVTADGGLDAADLQAVMDAGTVTDSGLLLEDVTSSSTLTADFDGVSTGEYNLTVSVSDTTAEDTDAIEVNSPGTITANFADKTVEEEEGDVLEFGVELSNTDSAQLSVGSDDVNYHVSMTVHDGDDDGEVTVMVNTYMAGQDGVSASEVYSAAGDDSVTDAERTTDALTSRLATGAYDLSISVGGEEKDVGSFFLVDRSTDNLQIWTAPRSASVDDLDDVQAALQAGAVTQADEVAIGDWVVIQVEASGVYGYLADVADLDDDGLSMSATQTNPEKNTDPLEFEYGDGSAAGVITDADNDTFFVAFREPNNEDFVGQIYEVAFTVGEDNGYVAEGASESVNDTYEITDRTASITTNTEDTLILQSSDAADVSGATTMAPGTEFTVQVRSDDPENPYLRRASVTVESDRTWSTSFNTSDLSEGASFTVSLLRGGTTFDSVAGEIGSPTSVSISDQSSNGASVMIDSVTMTAGGFVAIHEGGAGGPVIGSSKFLSAGTHEDVKITLDETYEDPQTVTLVAMPHKDTNNNGVYEFPDADGPYVEAGAPVTDSASVEVTEQTPTPRVVTVVQDSPTPVVETRVVEEEVEVTRTVIQERTVVVTQSPGQPGFGIAVAVLALLAAALLAHRRRD